ncbi:MAG: RHS repeat-associated core domain-containing protein [Pseudomonadota bacterium]
MSLISLQSEAHTYRATDTKYGFNSTVDFSYLCDGGTQEDACDRYEAAGNDEVCATGMLRFPSTTTFYCGTPNIRDRSCADAEESGRALSLKKVGVCERRCETANHENVKPNGHFCEHSFPEQTISAKQSPKNNPQGCQKSGSPVEGNPVNVATGNKSQIETDIQTLSPNGLVFRRYYSSMAAYSKDLYLGEPHAFATKWSHSYTRKLIIYGTDPQKLIYIRDDGQQFAYSRVSSSSPWLALDPDTPVKKIEPDNNGHRFILINQNDEIEVYDNRDWSAKLYSLTKNGKTIRFDYDLDISLGGDGNSETLDKITDHFGRTVSLAYTSGMLTNVTDPDGHTYSYIYDDNNNLTAVIYPDDTSLNNTDNPVRQYIYEDPRFANHLTGIIDENGDRFATWSYDDNGRAILSEHANSTEKFLFKYNENGSTTVTDQLGASRTYTFTEQYGVVKTASVQGDQCTFCGGQDQDIKYDSNGFVASRTDFNGNVTTYINNSRGLQTSRAEAFGTSDARTIITEWHTSLRLPTKISRPGVETTFSYNALGLIVARTDKDLATLKTRSTTYNYDSDGNLLTINGPLTHIEDITIYTYDDKGNRVSMSVDPDGAGPAPAQVTRFTSYDQSGRLLSMVNPNGVVTNLDYDARGRLSSRIYSVGTEEESIIIFNYDGVGNLVGIHLPNGNQINYSYDQARRLTRISDSLGNYIYYTLDNLGNKIEDQVFDADDSLMRIQTRTFDQLSRLIQMIGGENQVSVYGYDGNGNQVSVLDPQNRISTFAYDALNRLISQTDSDFNNTEYHYDDRDNLISVKDARGITTRYSFNGFDELIELDSPDTGVKFYSYDKAGNLVSETDARDITKTSTYDALNRLISISYPDSQYDVTYTYDAGLNGIGRLTSMTDNSGTTHYQYDSRGNLIQKDFIYGEAVFTTSYVYNLADVLIQTEYPSGRVVGISLDAMERIQDITTGFKGTQQTLVENVSYLPFGPISSFDYGNGLSVSESRDLDYRLTSQLTGEIHNISYSYDRNNNITAIQDHTDSSNNQSFSYDNLDRLQSESGSYGARDYLYDQVGNRTQRLKVDNRVDNQGQLYQSERIQAYIYNENANILDQVETVRDGVISENHYSYDANGNLKSRGINNPKVYGHGDNNRLTFTQKNGVTLAIYKYDGHGQRKLRYKFDNDACLAIVDEESCTDPNAIDESFIARTFIYHYDQQGQLLGETIFNQDNQLKRTREYVWLNQRPVAFIDTRYKVATGEIKSEKIYYIHSDQLGTPRKLTNQNQILVWRWDSDAFGQGQVQNDPDGDTKKINLPLRFPGQIQMEAGLRYNYYRDYSPAIGRYIQSDPIGLNGGLNTYSYTMQNPVNYYDHDGRVALQIVNLGIGAALGAYGAYLNGGSLISGAYTGAASNAFRGKATFNAVVGFVGNIAGQINDPCFDGLNDISFSEATTAAALNVLDIRGALPVNFQTNLVGTASSQLVTETVSNTIVIGGSQAVAKGVGNAVMRF